MQALFLVWISQKKFFEISFSMILTVLDDNFIRQVPVATRSSLLPWQEHPPQRSQTTEPSHKQGENSIYA